MKRKIRIFIIFVVLIISILCIIVHNRNKEKQYTFVKLNGNLYKQSDFSIDYAGGDIPKGKITKLSEEPIPQNNGETNKEYLVGKTIYGTKNILNDLHFKENDDAIVVETHNSYILFEKVK